MIEVTPEFIYYKKRKRRFKFKRFFSLLIVFGIIFLFSFYYKNFICIQINNLCKDYCYSYSTDSINKAILNSLTSSVKYEDLFEIEKNSSGDIVLMSTNSLKVNLINKEITQNSKIFLSEKLKQGVPVPLLSFTGIKWLAGYGANVNLKILSISSVTSEFESKFISVGINQTLHSIYIVIKSQISIEMPMNREEVEYSTAILISEAVLIGKVPEIYLNGNLFGGL